MSGPGRLAGVGAAHTIATRERSGGQRQYQADSLLTAPRRFSVAA
jgi:hypothetical protein